MVRSEEERFDAVLTAGLPRLEEVLDRADAGSTRASRARTRSGCTTRSACPCDFMEDLASQRGLAIDREGFEQAMEGQREKARAGSSFKGGDKALTFGVDAETERVFEQTGDQFEGYDATCVRGVPVLALFDEDGQPVPQLQAGSRGYVALASSPFYVEAGGQVSDAGAHHRRPDRRRRSNAW